MCSCIKVLEVMEELGATEGKCAAYIAISTDYLILVFSSFVET